MSRHIILSLLAFLFISCTSTKQIEIDKPKYPNWYLNQKFEDLSYLYGIGEGENIDEAIKSALISISSRLSLTISSNSTIKSNSYVDFREYITKESSQNISSFTENLTYSNYEIIDTQKISFNSIILNLKIKKIDLINSLSNKLNRVNKQLENSEIELKDKDPLTKFLNYKKLFNEYISIQNRVQILKKLDENFDDKNYFTKLDKIYNLALHNKSKSTFYITNYTNNQLIEDKLKEEINKDFPLLNRTNAIYNIDITSNINKKNSHGFYIVDNYISFKIYFGNKLIKTKNYLTKGASSNSFDDAINNSYEEINLSGFIGR